MKDCLFCKIINGDIPSTKIFENDHVLGFRDINPVAKIHNLFISKNHSTNINNMTEVDNKNITEIFNAIKSYTEQEKISDFRVVTNCGAKAGQTVFHTHFHIISDERLGNFGK